MSFKGPGGSRRLGLAICCSVVAHIVAFGVLMLIGGVSSSPTPSPAEPKPAEAENVDQPAPEAEDPIAAAAKADAERAAAEAAKRESARAAKAGKSNPETKPVPPKKPAETRKPVEKKPEAAKPDTKPEPKADAAADADKAEWKSYEVRPGESLTKIAAKCGCTVQELAKANNLKPTANLFVGQKIKIKASAE